MAGQFFKSLSQVYAIKIVVTVAIFILICIAAALGGPDAAQGSRWYSIVPPLVAVCLALLTQKLLLSLSMAVLVGGLLATVPGHLLIPGAWFEGIFTGLKFAGSTLWDFEQSSINSWNIQIIAFVIPMLMMISVMILSGGLKGVADYLVKYAKTKRSTKIVTMLMGMVVFIDDYANTMIVGSAMKPLTDRFKVSREKLAFLVDSTSAPVAGVALVSTWVGYEIGLFNEVAQSLSVAKDGYSLFFDALGYRFYCFMMLIFVFCNVISGRDFWSMARAEKRAEQTGQVINPQAAPMTSKTFSSLEADPRAISNPWTALIPIGVLFFGLILGLWYDGGGFEKIAEVGISGLSRLSVWRDVIGGAENNITVLAISAAVGLMVACLCGVLIGKLSFLKVLSGILSGAKASALPVLILVLAWSLKASCDELETGTFLAAAINQVLTPMWFPFLLFLVSALTSFATGTSWGTMAILIPTAIPVAYSLDGGTYGIITMISLGAVLDGSIFGDHCSPISDTTIMSSISSCCNHIDHVRTQLPYSLLVGSCALFLGYLPASMGVSSWISLSLATLLFACLFFMKKSPLERFATIYDSKE